jgi:hypothetical protein
MQDKLIAMNRQQQEKERQIATQQEARKRKAQQRAIEAERKREFVEIKQIEDERTRIQKYEIKKHKLQNMEKRLNQIKQEKQNAIHEKSEINTFKITNVIEQANENLEKNKAKIISKQQEAERRILENKELLKAQERIKREKFLLKWRAKAINVERTKKKMEYKTLKTKEIISYNEQRKNNLIEHKEAIKRMRLQNMQESELMRERVREALYHMAVWNVVDMEAINDIMQGSQTNRTIGDIIRSRVGPKTVCNFRVSDDTKKANLSSCVTDRNYPKSERNLKIGNLKKQPPTNSNLHIEKFEDNKNKLENVEEVKNKSSNALSKSVEIRNEIMNNSADNKLNEKMDLPIQPDEEIDSPNNNLEPHSNAANKGNANENFIDSIQEDNIIMPKQEKNVKNIQNDIIADKELQPHEGNPQIIAAVN